MTVIEGDGSVLLVCEHAGFSVPGGWGTLGLDPCYFTTHFAGDIGAADLTEGLARALGLPAVLATYSRMFLDYNRFETHWEYCRPDLGGIPVPGNLKLTAEEKALRTEIAAGPVDRAIEAQAERVRALISIHTFTPVFHGVDREVDVGLVWPSSSEFGAMVSSVMHRVGVAHGVRVADNVPYAWTDTGARTLNVHGTARGRKAVCIEVNNALLLDPDTRRVQAAFLAEALAEVAKAL
ncbi:MAG: N-formylglutamate amidohydrolase [Rhodobacterales bacterium]|nr:N-formylglutamate amidohydrolase [Rhodobacterales bacterium]